MAEDAVEMVYLRNAFYRDSYRRVLLTLLLSMVIVVLLAGVLVYQITHPPMPKYFATSINGRITPLTPLNRPNQAQPALLQWANQAAISAYTYNFVTYRKELQAASAFFTPKGWSSFQSALRTSNNLDAVKAKKLIVSAVATGAPIILKEEVVNGIYTWRVQMPMLVTFQSASEISQQRLMVVMSIVRVSTLDSARGIGISSFVAQPTSGLAGL